MSWPRLRPCFILLCLLLSWRLSCYLWQHWADTMNHRKSGHLELIITFIQCCKKESYTQKSYLSKIKNIELKYYSGKSESIPNKMGLKFPILMYLSIKSNFLGKNIKYQKYKWTINVITCMQILWTMCQPVTGLAQIEYQAFLILSESVFFSVFAV